MSSTLSNISGPKYGYDFVVATTQASINAALLAFLSTRKEPVVAVCYVADPEGMPVPIDYDQLKKDANGTDPFCVHVRKNTNIATDPNIQNLTDARFLAGFRAQIGLPHVSDPSQLPDVVTLDSGTSSVQFNMLCSQFTVVQFNPGSIFTRPSWLNISQPANAPWIFTSKVDMRLSTVDQSLFSKLPPIIQQKIKNLDDTAFSVQQLLFDLTNAALMTVPTITGVTPGTVLSLLLQQYFLSAYFTQLKEESLPLLGCSIVLHNAPVSTLSLTNFNFNVNPYMNSTTQEPYQKPTKDQKQLATLNYLCAADGHTLPPAVTFPWNWVDATQLNDHDGTIAINRNTFANYFRNQLAPYVPRNCILPQVSVDLSGFLDTTVVYKWSLSPGQAPTVTTPSAGKTVLIFDYTQSSEDDAGLHGDMGSLRLANTYNLTVDFVGNTIVVTQHLICYMWVRRFQTSGEGNIIDKKIVDTYSIGVDANGKLVSSPPQSVTTDDSYSPSVNSQLNFFTNFNDVSNDITNNVRGFAATRLQDMPISTVQNFIFPGGKTFIFKSVGFSDFQDLVSFISYADPTGPTATVPAPAAKVVRHVADHAICRN